MIFHSKKLRGRTSCWLDKIHSENVRNKTMKPPYFGFHLHGQHCCSRVELIPCSLHKLGTDSPALAYFKILMIKLSEYLDVFIENLLKSRVFDFLFLSLIIWGEHYLLYKDEFCWDFWVSCYSFFINISAILSL